MRLTFPCFLAIMDSRLLVLPNPPLMVSLSYWEGRGDELLPSRLWSQHQHPSSILSSPSCHGKWTIHACIQARIRLPPPLPIQSHCSNSFSLSLSHYQLVLRWLDHSNQHVDVATNYFTFGKLNCTAQHAEYFHKCYLLSFLQVCVVESISLVWWHKGVRYTELIKNEAWI